MFHKVNISYWLRKINYILNTGAEKQKKKKKKNVGGGPWKEWMHISFIFTIWEGDGKKTNLLKFKLLALLTETWFLDSLIDLSIAEHSVNNQCRPKVKTLTIFASFSIWRLTPVKQGHFHEHWTNHEACKYVYYCSQIKSTVKLI